MFDMANFAENATVKKDRKPANICQSYERMYSCTVFLYSLCIAAATVQLIRTDASCKRRLKMRFVEAAQLRSSVTAFVQKQLT